MEEYFDILNEKGAYLNKTASREECHIKGLWHKAVALFIINSNRQVLLQKRSANKKLWPNMWDMTAGGHVLEGEFGYQAVIRETYEELGIKIEKNDCTYIGSAISQNVKGEIKNNHFNEYYIVNKDINIDNIKLQEEEVSELKWVDEDEIIRRIKNNYEGITDKEGCWEYLVKYYELTKK